MTCTEMAFFPSNFMLQNPHEDDHHQPPPSFITPILPPSCTPQDFNGVASLLGKRSMSFGGIDVCEETNGEEDLSDEDGLQIGERKRRLNMEQVKTLEKNFELGNKLEPERKMQLARALGLQPRQIAIWFQNRRARWKTKQLEKDYQVLKRQFDSIKSENDSLHAQNQKLRAKILGLKNREPTESINLNKETEGSSSNRSENSSDDIKVEILRATAATESPLPTNNPMQTTSTSFFPSSMKPTGTTVQPHLFQTSSTRSTADPQSHKMDHHHHHHHHHHHQTVKEESLSNIFCGMDDQTGFWPWLEQHHFN